MKKNILIITILLLGVILITFGVFYSVNDSATNNKNNQDQQNSQTNEKNPDTIENENPDIKKEQCLENICVNDLTISNQAGIYSVSGTISNNGTEDIADKAINLVFTAKDGTEIKTTYYIIKIAPKQSHPLEIQFTAEDKELMDASNYKIVQATQEEYNQVKNNIVN